MYLINVITCRFALCAVLFMAAHFSLSAQTPDTAVPQTPEESASVLPTAYRGLSLGMTLDALKEALTIDSAFTFRGDPDVSFLPVTQQNLVESGGTAYIKRAFFQLKDDAVFVMSFTMNTTLIDHYSIFTELVKKYGQPIILNPREAIWESPTTRISIERPLTVKYIDKQVFDGLVENSQVLRSHAAEMREEFLNDF